MWSKSDNQLNALYISRESLKDYKFHNVSVVLMNPGYTNGRLTEHTHLAVC
jgi:hypothetical protein